MANNITVEQLRGCLLDLEQLELKGMGLLERVTLFGQLPDAEDEILEATKELIAYIDMCNQVADRLKDLPATIASGDIPEFGL